MKKIKKKEEKRLDFEYTILTLRQGRVALDPSLRAGALRSIWSAARPSLRSLSGLRHALQKNRKK